MSLRHIAVPGAIALCLLAGACSSSSSGGSPSTSASAPAPQTSTASSSASSPSSSTASTGSVPSRAALASVVLHQSDLPAGFTGKPADPAGQGDQQTDAKLAACVGTDLGNQKNHVQQVQSDDFTMGQLTVSSDASSYRSQSDVDNQVKLFESPKIQPCVNTVLRQQLAATLPATARLTTVAIKFTKGADGGPQNEVGHAEGRIGLRVQGKTVYVYLYLAFITGRLLTGSLSFTGVGRPGSDSLVTTAVGAFAKRAAKV